MGGLVPNSYGCMRNLLKYLVAFMGYKIVTHRVTGRDRKKLLRNLRK
ncbi:hypothetical protein H6769_02635 [Candidatus Peribacteria bacterium]|nr:hypothetical protein [Candidatus Peribacteria bacterium]